MEYSPYRLLAALNFLLCFTVVLIPVCGPLGVFFWWVAHKREREEKEFKEAMKEAARSDNDVD